MMATGCLDVRRGWIPVLALVGLLLLSACASSSEQEAPESEVGEPSPPVRILALGDSYTIGEGVELEESWPAQLAARLRASGLTIADPVVIARTGWTTEDLAEAIGQIDPTGPFDLVTLQIGVNNQASGGSMQVFEQEFASLLERSIALAGGDPGRVVVLSIPDWSVTPVAAAFDKGQIARDVADFNVVVRRASDVARVHFLDVTPISLQAATESGLLAGDGLHPSGLMYQRWMDLLLPIAESLVSVAN